MLSGAIQHQVAHEAPLAARPGQPKFFADKGIVLEIKPKNMEQEEQYEDELEEKDKSDLANALSPQMASII